MTRQLIIAGLTGTLLSVGSAHAETVEIYLVDMLDNIQNGYCLDIARAQGAQANPDEGLQGPTCYGDGGKPGDAGTLIGLATCDGSDAQSFVFSGEGSIVPASAPDMCFTLAGNTRTGRSDANQIKVLSLETCLEDQTAFQTWAVRTAAE